MSGYFVRFFAWSGERNGFSVLQKYHIFSRYERCCGILPQNTALISMPTGIFV